jgi:hypothetical protein
MIFITCVCSQPYPYMAKETVALLGDAAHPVGL